MASPTGYNGARKICMQSVYQKTKRLHFLRIPDGMKAGQQSSPCETTKQLKKYKEMWEASGERPTVPGWTAQLKPRTTTQAQHQELARQRRVNHHEPLGKNRKVEAK